MSGRKGGVYWISNKRILIFDAGYEKGFIHVCKPEYSIGIDDIRREIESTLGEIAKNWSEDMILREWIKRKFGCDDPPFYPFEK